MSANRVCCPSRFLAGITGWVCDDRPERGAAQLAALLPLIPGAEGLRQRGMGAGLLPA